MSLTKDASTNSRGLLMELASKFRKEEQSVRIMRSGKPSGSRIAIDLGFAPLPLSIRGFASASASLASLQSHCLSSRLLFDRQYLNRASWWGLIRIPLMFAL